MIRLGSTFAAVLLVVAVCGGCSKTGSEISTAERVKRVEQQQRTDANFHLERKAPAAAPAAPARSSQPVGLASGESPASARAR